MIVYLTFPNTAFNLLEAKLRDPCAPQQATLPPIPSR